LILDYSKDCDNAREFFFKCTADDLNYGMLVACHKRFACQCPECSKRWKKKKIAQFIKAVDAMRNPKFLTLTLTRRRSSYENLDRAWNMRRELFKRIRKKGYKIDSWIGVIEFPVHIHLVIDCQKFVPQPFIKAIWHTITGDSYIVHIKRCGDRLRMVWYLSKYLGKGLGDLSLNADEIKGFHIVQSYNLPSYMPKPKICPVCGCVHYVSMITEEEYWHDSGKIAEIRRGNG